jgi:hypothetical protein
MKSRIDASQTSTTKHAAIQLALACAPVLFAYCRRGMFAGARAVLLIFETQPAAACCSLTINTVTDRSHLIG